MQLPFRGLYVANGSIKSLDFAHQCKRAFSGAGQSAYRVEELSVAFDPVLLEESSTDIGTKTIAILPLNIAVSKITI